MSVMDRPLVPHTVVLVDNAFYNSQTQKITSASYNFPFNLNTLDWTYQTNTQSYDTIGGRVTQILSVRATTMQLQGEAGSRGALLDLYTIFKSIQDNQSQYKVSATLHVPSQNLNYRVWLKQMQIAWDVTTVTYPYNMSFEIQQDLSAANAVMDAAADVALNQIAANIGFSPGWTGLSSSDMNLSFTAVKQYLDSIPKP